MLKLNISLLVLLPFWRQSGGTLMIEAELGGELYDADQELFLTPTLTYKMLNAPTTNNDPGLSDPMQWIIDEPSSEESEAKPSQTQAGRIVKLNKVRLELRRMLKPPLVCPLLRRRHTRNWMTLC